MHAGRRRLGPVAAASLGFMLGLALAVYAASYTRSITYLPGISVVHSFHFEPVLRRVFNPAVEYTLLPPSLRYTQAATAVLSIHPPVCTHTPTRVRVGVSLSVPYVRSARYASERGVLSLDVRRAYFSYEAEGGAISASVEYTNEAVSPYTVARVNSTHLRISAFQMHAFLVCPVVTVGGCNVSYLHTGGLPVSQPLAGETAENTFLSFTAPAGTVEVWRGDGSIPYKILVNGFEYYGWTFFSNLKTLSVQLQAQSTVSILWRRTYQIGQPINVNWTPPWTNITAPDYDEIRIEMPLPDWLREHRGLVAVAIILGLMLLATETTAPFFFVACLGLLWGFTSSGWIQLNEAWLGLLALVAGLAWVLARKQS